ncbi:MAG: acyl-CoA dehydrogenase family protein [Bacillota bacterium]|nr:acyl-CoA dehydrogenase family protein [Bacillota bacterium]
MNFLLSEKDQSRQAEFCQFAEIELDTDDLYPHENLKKAAEKGYMGVPLPVEYGGMGEDFLTYIILIEEISRICASTGVIMAVHTSVGTFPLFYFGTEEQKKRYLPRLAAGEMLGAFALTEAEAGSDAAALSTTAKAVEGGYILNGCKLFITSGGEADLYTVFATVDRSLGRKGITAFIVEKGPDGPLPGKPEKKMGLNRSHTTELRMEDLFVPVSNRLGGVGEGFNIAMALLDGGRIGIAAQGLGLARASIEFAAEKLKELKNSGINIDQGKSFILADLATGLEAARLMVYKAAIAKGAGMRCSREASMAKLFATDLAVKAAEKAIDLCGLESATVGSPLKRYFCDSKALQIYEGTNQIQRIVVARELLK